MSDVPSRLRTDASLPLCRVTTVTLTVKHWRFSAFTDLKHATLHAQPPSTCRHIDNFAAAVRLLASSCYAGACTKWTVAHGAWTVALWPCACEHVRIGILSLLPNYGERALAMVEQRHPSNAPAANRKPITSARVNAIMKKQQNCN